MRTTVKRGILFSGLAGIGLIVAGLVFAAPTGNDFAIISNTVDGGGGTSTGGSFSLTGTIGQPDASAVLTGAGFALAGGFWGNPARAGHIFSDGYE